ncbi:ATP-binding protein [Streptomyces sp. NPDC057376]|uniref:ATP-binding protein n=1 Tax=unclassified Streptomyces TaxID=2593676 RepID=UPI00093E41C5|nr:ATP-binding protein [Streptomyces sp. CB02414]
MKDEQILAYFDGRGTAEITLTGREVSQSNRIAAVAFELGYKLHETDIVTRGQWRLTYLRDDSPDVRHTGDVVTVGVTDSGRSGGTPSATAAGAECERGRGLLITDALAGRWGTRRAGGGLTVWAEVAVGAAADVSVGAG